MTDRETAKRQLFALVDSIGDAEPSEEAKQQAQALIFQIAKDSPHTRHLTEALLLIESIESPSAPLSAENKARLVAALWKEGDNKIAMFSAMCQAFKRI